LCGQNVVLLDPASPVVSRLLRDFHGVFSDRLSREALKTPAAPGRATTLQNLQTAEVSRSYRQVLTTNIGHVDDTLDR
jgi:hypothetical protein